MSDTNMGEEKMFIALAGIGSIFGFILPLVAWLLKKDSFSAYSKKFILDMLNFELVLFIAFFVLSFIPILGWLVNLGLMIFNIVVIIRAYSAAQEQKEYNLPFKYQLIKG